MNKIMFIWGCLLAISSHAVVYDDYELNYELNQPSLVQMSQHFAQVYFTAHTAETAIDTIIKADLSTLQREYILFNLLTEISQQPPQDFHQYFIDLMKTYQVQATKAADEGSYPVAVFNLNSKAHGIENIWLAFRTEQRFNQLFAQDVKQAVAGIKTVLADPTPQQRPQWLGVKNSMAALSNIKLTEMTQLLQKGIKVNAGLDQLISHVALLTADNQLIHKTLSSNDQSIREFTLRNLVTHFSADKTKALLLAAIKNKQDTEFATSLLAPFSDDLVVQNHLIQLLNNDKSADNAAFALSQSTDNNLPERLKLEYIKTTDQGKRNHILLALKLTHSSAAQLALNDLKTHIKSNSKSEKWLKSFAGELP